MNTQINTANFTLADISRLIDKPIFNALWFNIFWFSAVVGREPYLMIPLVLLTVHFIVVGERRKELIQAALIAPIGISIDATLSFLGFYNFANDALIPLWLCCLWIAFALSVSRSLFFLSRYPLSAVIVGGVGGTMSYFAGNKLGAVTFGEPVINSIIVIATVWACILPTFLWLTKNLKSSLR